MSVLDVVLHEEYERLGRIIKGFSKELESLPKGYISKKKIRGHTYYYLQYREGKKVKSEYIKKQDVDMLLEQVERRKELANDIKDLERDKRKIERIIRK